jgi:hypothetical protein
VIDPAGRVRTASVAQSVPIGELSTVPALSAAAASATAARAETDQADKAPVTTRQATAQHATAEMVGAVTTQLVVYALGATPRLAWQASDNIATTHVDASSGAVLGRRDTIAYGTGNSARNGPNPIFGGARVRRCSRRVDGAADAGSDTSVIGYGGRSCPRHRTAAVRAQFAHRRVLCVDHQGPVDAGAIEDALEAAWQLRLQRHAD